MKNRMSVKPLGTKPAANHEGANVGTNQYYWLLAWLFG